MFNIIAKIALTTAATAIASYAGKAMGEKIKKDFAPELKKANDRIAAKKLASAIIKTEAAKVSGIEDNLWIVHGLAKKKYNEATSAVVAAWGGKEIITLQAVKCDDDFVTLTVNMEVVAKYKNMTVREVMEKAIIEYGDMVVAFELRDKK